MDAKLLEGMAVQALNMIKTDMRVAKNWTGFLFAVYNESEGLYRMRKLERYFNEQFGEGWLDSGAAKDRVFGGIRALTPLMMPDAIVFGNGVNKFEETEKLLAMGEAAVRELAHGGHDRQHQAVREGLLTVQDALFTLAQTPEQVCLCTQRLGPRGIHVGAPEIKMLPQDGWDGRTKMFGKGKHTAELELPPDMARELMELLKNFGARRKN